MPTSATRPVCPAAIDLVKRFEGVKTRPPGLITRRAAESNLFLTGA